MKVLVTGGNGFLGRAIVRQLLDAGYQVRSLSRKPSLQLESWDVEQFQGDIQEKSTIRESVEGCDAVIHTAAKAGYWGSALEYEQINLHGTISVLGAVKEAGISRFVHTSSPSVVFDGKDETNLCEDKAGYPRTFFNEYSRTKALAEQEVLAANSPSLATVALRPHLIWGPGDPHLLPRLWARALKGKLRLVGSGRNRIDMTYIDNAAEAHLLALEKLAPNSSCAGQTYFISNGDPQPIADLFARFLALVGLPGSIPRVSEWVAMGVARWSEFRSHLTGSKSEPLLTRFVVQQLAREHWFDLTKARRDLGYAPRISTEVGLQRLKQSLSAVKMPDSGRSLCVGN